MILDLFDPGSGMAKIRIRDLAGSGNVESRMRICKKGMEICNTDANG
jgi:hypothetical protein